MRKLGVVLVLLGGGLWLGKVAAHGVPHTQQQAKKQAYEQALINKGKQLGYDEASRKYDAQLKTKAHEVEAWCLQVWKHKGV